MTDKPESETSLPLKDYGTTQLLYTYPCDGSVPLNNFPTSMHFRSRTEAIERLCLKVFGETPVYETDIEDFKAETSKESSVIEERDEAREDLKITQEAWVQAKAERAEALRQRDEALEAAEKHENRYREIKKQLADEKAHLALIKRERDEALEDLEFRRELFKLQEVQLNDIRKERDLKTERALADKFGNALSDCKAIGKWEGGREMSERPTPETDSASFPDGVKMLTAQSNPIELYHKLCEVCVEFEAVKRERDDLLDAALDLVSTARRVRSKFGRDKNGTPRDWTEWRDIDDACNAIDRIVNNNDIIK